jgi:tRNA(Ile)-lysidine synthase
MLSGANGVLIAVSGGADSVALLDMLLRIARDDTGLGAGVAEAQTAAPASCKPRLHVAHLDHMLRGRESAEDAEFVRALASELGLHITVNAFDVRAAAARTGRGIEEVAREIRYNFLLAAATGAGCDRIAVGHTMTDQAETFLMRLIRGAGMRGLAAMRPVIPALTFPDSLGEKAEGGRQKPEIGTPPADSDLPFAFHFPLSVSIIRPLLCITREEVESYCGEQGLRFRTDATNFSLRHTRNRIRTSVLPALATINPRIVESISRAAENIFADQEVLDDLALSLLLEVRTASDASTEGSIAAYSIPALLEQPLGMRRRIIVEAMRLARRNVAPRETEFGAEIGSVHVDAVAALLTDGASGKRVGLPGLLEVWREYDALVFRRTRNQEAPYLVTISLEHSAVEAGGFAFVLERGLPAELIGPAIEGVKQEMETTGRNWMSVALDDAKLPYELVIRPRLSGERARVLGQRRTIKLKNLMIDHRIPSSRRSTWPLLTTPDGAYIWSPGLPPAVEFAAHEGTKRLATVRASAI